MNNYLLDSGIFFKEVSRRIQLEMSDNEVIQLSFNLALGCERLLKGILYDINPTYILIEPDFKHSLKTLYSHKIISEAMASKELATKPNPDVISFNNSLLKAQHISNTVASHKNILFAISRARDIIAHCELNLLEKNKIKEVLQRDFYTMLKSFSDELDIKQSHFFDGSRIKLSRISGSLQTDLNKKMSLLFETHLATWQILKGRSGFVVEKDSITKEILKTENKESIDCPACESTAVIYLKPIIEFDQLKLEEEIIGFEVKKLKCQYCKLEIQDSSILDKLGISDKKVHKNKNCAYCGVEMAKDEACETCENCENSNWNAN
ncbi:hypothetical protein AAGV33_03515 [Flavobacterium sp. FBOR7N2.3]|uniref:Uncharacterized protein n=1 Tax=Flavobacterium magnesitis TaxID=3138077 RepID=A0ABV4TH80_9FLAO